MLNDLQVKNAIQLFPKIDTLFVGIGSIETNPVLHSITSEISDLLSREILDSNSIGDISLHFFDHIGNEINTPLKDLIIGVSFKQMKKIKNVVGIAGGPSKTEVIHASLIGKKINILITDSLTAQKLLSM